MSANNMGCLQNAVFSNSNSGKVFDLTGQINTAYDIYFRILIPNQANNLNRLSGYRITYKERDGGGNINSTDVELILQNWSN